MQQTTRANLHFLSISNHISAVSLWALIFIYYILVFFIVFFGCYYWGTTVMQQFSPQQCWAHISAPPPPEQQQAHSRTWIRLTMAAKPASAESKRTDLRASDKKCCKWVCYSLNVTHYMTSFALLNFVLFIFQIWCNKTPLQVVFTFTLTYTDHISKGAIRLKELLVTSLILTLLCQEYMASRTYFPLAVEICGV